MKKLVAIAFVLATTCNVANAEWSVKGNTNEVDLYVDVSTIKWTGDTAKMTYMFNRKQRSEKGWLSSVTTSEFYCKERAYRGLAVTLYRNGMGSGEIIFKGDSPSPRWPLDPGGLSEAMFNIACEKK